MYCVNCNDPVCIRTEREGVIHKNGRYGCRTRSHGELTVAEVGDAAALNRLRVAATVKVPVEKPEPVRKGRSHSKDDDDRFV